MFRAVLVTVAALAVAAATAETQAALSFDVASVKRNQDLTSSSAGVQIRPEQLEAIWVPLQALIIQAYGVSAGRILGMPDWARTERYDVRARTSKPSSRQEILAMLQSLLADRFSIKVHRETREMDVYALVLIKPGSPGRRLQPVVVDCETNKLADGSGSGLFPPNARPPCGNMISNARFRPEGGPSVVHNSFAAVTMERLASGLAGTGRPVIDKTGLMGTFDVEMEYVSEGAPVAAPASKESLTGLTLREALKQYLGLELRSERGPVEYLVIDSIARPTPD